MDIDNDYNSDKEKEDIDNSKQERIKALLVRIGEKSASPLNKNLEMLSRALIKDLSEYSDFILDILLQCVVHLTAKTGVYGTLVGLLNLQEPNFGKLVVKRISHDLSVSLSSCDFPRINILIRFLAELLNSSVISAQDLLFFLNKLSDAFLSKSQSPKISDFFFYCVIGTLPYSGFTLLQKESDDLANLLRRLTVYYESREHDSPLQYCRVIKESGTKPLEDFIDVYWKSLIDSSQSEWKTDVVIKPARDFSEQFEKNKQHSFVVSFDEKLDLKGKESPLFCSLLNIFDSNEITDKRSIRSNINRCILFEYYSDIILYFEDNKNECVKQLLYLTELNNSYFLLIESVFSLMLQLPFSQSNSVFYGCLIGEFFKVKPKIFPKIVGKCVGILFDKIDLIDIECRDRLSNWFAVHLSNFGFKWAWGNWSFVSTLPDIAPKRVFCESVLRGCRDLSSSEMNFGNEELKSILPKNFRPNFKYKDVVSQKVEEDQNEDKKIVNVKGNESSEQTNGFSRKEKELENSEMGQNGGIEEDPDTKFGEEDNRMCDEDDENECDWLSSARSFAAKSKLPLDDKAVAAGKLLELLERKENAEALYQYLCTLRGQFGEPEAFEIFFQCLLFAGSGNFSDLFRLFDKYKPTIIQLKPSEKAQKVIVSTVLDFWADSHLHLIIILQKLVTYGFIKTDNMVKVLLSEKHLAFFYKSFYSMILTNLIDLFSQRIFALKKILDKEFPEHDNKNKGDLMQKILTTNSDRQAMLRIIIERLKLAMNYFIKNVEYYKQNELYKVISERFVMFLRKYRETVNEMREELTQNVFSGEDNTEIMKVFCEIK